MSLSFLIESPLNRCYIHHYHQIKKKIQSFQIFKKFLGLKIMVNMGRFISKYIELNSKYLQNVFLDLMPFGSRS